MNIHPIFVHFPIALLSIYAVFECIRFKKIAASESWFYVKSAFLLLGGLGALAAAATGDFGKSLFPDARAIIAVHEMFAKTTIVIFGILAIVYFVALADRLFGTRIRQMDSAKIWEPIMKVDAIFLSGWFTVPVSIIGFFVVLITGSLGGAIAYGPSADIFTSIATHLFVH